MKIKMLKEYSSQPWFDWDEMKKVSMALSLIIHWLKGVLHNWNALTNVLKNDKKMSQSSIDKINCMENYVKLNFENQRLEIANSIHFEDIKILKAFNSPPKIVTEVTAAINFMFRHDGEWRNF